MLNLLIVFVAAALLVGLLHYDSKERRRGRLLAKTTLSSLFILAALVQPHPTPIYYQFLLAGLIFSLGGDVCLALSHKQAFPLGLLSFLIGHLFYILAFFHVSQLNLWTWIGSLVGVFVSGTVYFWLKPHLGSMKIPVLIYLVVITVMVAGAWSVLGDSGLNQSGRVMVIVGGLSFYFSDVFVARDRFLQRKFLNKLIGLPTYYLGQFLLAFSVGML
jgi:uncharacterized membrane protein YhhN